VSRSPYIARQPSEIDMTWFSTERYIAQALPTAAGGAERDAVLRYFQALVDDEFASWWINEAGGTELHFVDGEAFLLQDDGIVRLR
jgi:hypothetical protein